MGYPVKIQFKRDNKLLNKYNNKILRYTKKIKKLKFKNVLANDNNIKQNIIINPYILRNIINYNIYNNNWLIKFVAYILCLPKNFDYNNMSNTIKKICMNIFKTIDMDIIINTIYKIYPQTSILLSNGIFKNNKKE
ncbi:hypothetical protein AHEV_113 [Adoxophyes honmai entomopoxvirus 'L']|uniref:Uncharacterized protein n=1 Tax=Adoxophyes honmai entomopoxvirus 'L' TaxID=1293540 RepID=A0A916KP32_9POXV|nr:hypothetical protein AHEV_113 [Adoxophyes honmai entomopoxvirus 'L']CCU55434.1 hypothetical protein AHEV_113 [Adoxophyes honmai entomopoxvirus 'L']